MFAIKANNISKSYRSGKITNQILKDINAEFRSGELTLILGPSGSGKSTMVAALSGLLKVDKGEVMIEGQNLSDLSNDQIEKLRLEKIGFIFQGFNLFSSLKALDQVIIILKYLGYSYSEAKIIAEKALESVGMKNKMHLRPIELSGGEKQRVAIARAIVKKPRILFADEPTSSLDKENGAKIIKILKDMARDNNTAAIIVTHDYRLYDYADRIIEIEDGTIKYDSQNKYTEILENIPNV